MFSNTFTGITPANVLPFILCQILGALIAWFILGRIKSKDG
jgi:glycerol uptake facilitator-like aquaporin